MSHGNVTGILTLQYVLIHGWTIADIYAERIFPKYQNLVLISLLVSALPWAQVHCVVDIIKGKHYQHAVFWTELGR